MNIRLKKNAIILQVVCLFIEYLNCFVSSLRTWPAIVVLLRPGNLPIGHFTVVYHGLLLCIPNKRPGTQYLDQDGGRTIFNLNRKPRVQYQIWKTGLVTLTST